MNVISGMIIDSTWVKLAGIVWPWVDARWRSSTAMFTLPLDALHLWRGHVDTWVHGLDGAVRLLTESEQQRAAGIRNTRRRQQFLAARSLTRVLVNLYLQRGDVRLIEDERGRIGIEAHPFCPPLFLSISHTDNLFIVAVSRRRCAVDMEKTKDIRNYSRVTRQLLPDEYCHALLHRNEHPSEQARLFIKCWTALEALFKLHGEGNALHYFRKMVTNASLRDGPQVWGCHFDAYPGYIGAATACNEFVAPVFYDADAIFGRVMNSGHASL